MPLVFLDRQHSGRWGDRRGDLGATAPSGRREALLTPLYLYAAELRLRELGHEVLPISHGTYAQRHAWANEIAEGYAGRSAYVAAHINAGGGDYGLVCYDHRSGASNGPALAAAVARILQAQMGIVVRAERASPSSWSSAYGTISTLRRPVGLCFEPYFIDTHQAFSTEEGLERIGRALAEGIHAWTAP